MFFMLFIIKYWRNIRPLLFRLQLDLCNAPRFSPYQCQTCYEWCFFWLFLRDQDQKDHIIVWMTQLRSLISPQELSMDQWLTVQLIVHILGPLPWDYIYIIYLVDFQELLGGRSVESEHLEGGDLESFL